MASPQLLWALTRKWNSFQVTRGPKAVLSAEPGNLTNVPGAKHSGLANARSVDVAQDPVTGKVTLALKTRSAATKPKKATHKLVLKTADPHRGNRIIKKLISAQFYNPRNERAALQRYAKTVLAARRAQRQSAGALKVRYGRGSQPYDFTARTKGVKPAAAGGDDDDMPALS